MGLAQAAKACRAVTVLVASMSVSATLASQGPGGGPGTASPSVQWVMTIIVYGGVALVVIAGIIGSLKRRL